VCVTALVLASGALVAACRTGGDPVDPGQPASTSSTSTPEIPATTMPGTPSRPSPLVAVGDDGALVILQNQTGERLRELAGPAVGDIVGVTVSSDTATVWFDADGTIYEVAVDGSGDPRPVATGTSPEASTDGTALAYADGATVAVRDLATGDDRTWTDSGSVTSLAWTADGRDLAWVRDGTQLVHLDVDGGAGPRVVAAAMAGEQLWSTLASPGGLASVMVGSGPDDTDPERITVGPGTAVDRSPDSTGGGALDRAWDRSLAWGLRTDAWHVVRWSVGGGTGAIARGYTAADW